MHTSLRKVALLLLAACFWLPSTVHAQSQPLNVFYAGPPGALRTALELDKDISLTTNADLADLFVLDGTFSAVDDLTLKDRLHSGAGLLLVLGPELKLENLGWLLGTSATFEPKDDPLSLTPVAGNPDSLLKDVLWTSAPQVRERIQLSGSNSDPVGDRLRGWLAHPGKNDLRHRSGVCADRFP